MNTPTENDSNTTNPPKGGPTGNSPNGGDPSEDSPNKGDANDVAPGRGAGRGSPAARRRVTPEEWRRLRAPFSREAYVVGSRATGRPAANLPLKAYSEEAHPDRAHSNKSQSGDERESSGRDLNQAVVDLWLRPEAIRDRLDLVLSPGRYGYRLEPGPKVGGTFSMRCHLFDALSPPGWAGATDRHRDRLEPPNGRRGRAGRRGGGLRDRRLREDHGAAGGRPGELAPAARPGAREARTAGGAVRVDPVLVDRVKPLQVGPKPGAPESVGQP